MNLIASLITDFKDLMIYITFIIQVHEKYAITTRCKYHALINMLLELVWTEFVWSHQHHIITYIQLYKRNRINTNNILIIIIIHH